MYPQQYRVTGFHRWKPVKPNNMCVSPCTAMSHPKKLISGELLCTYISLTFYDSGLAQSTHRILIPTCPFQCVTSFLTSFLMSYTSRKKSTKIETFVFKSRVPLWVGHGTSSIIPANLRLMFDIESFVVERYHTYHINIYSVSYAST